MSNSLAFSGTSNPGSLISNSSPYGLARISAMTSSLGRSLSNGLSTSLTPFPVLLSKNENAVLPLGRRIRLPFPTVHASIHWMQSRPHMSDSATQTSSSSSALSRSNPSSSAAVSAALNPIASPPQACPWNSWHSFQSLSFTFSPDRQ